jgi:diamine N-acetyltransferase
VRYGVGCSSERRLSASPCQLLVAWTGARRSRGTLEESDREAVDALRVSPGQERFVISVAESLREAAEHPGAHAQCWVVHDGDTPVGFVMIADEVDGPDYVPHHLWKLLIDERHQGRGLGTATLDGSPIAFYERYGFERTGEVVDGEVELQLRLT